MSCLCDSSILRNIQEGNIFVDPFDPNLIQPASLEIRLGEHFNRSVRHSLVDTMHPPARVWWQEGIHVPIGEAITIYPGECMLACSMETIGLSSLHKATVCGKSSWGRIFLLVHMTAGFI